MLVTFNCNISQFPTVCQAQRLFSGHGNAHLTVCGAVTNEEAPVKVKAGRQKAYVFPFGNPATNDLPLLEANFLFSGRFLLLKIAKDLATGSIPVLKQIQKFPRLGQVWVNGSFAKINCLKKYKKSPAPANPTQSPAERVCVGEGKSSLTDGEASFMRIRHLQGTFDAARRKGFACIRADARINVSASVCTG